MEFMLIDIPQQRLVILFMEYLLEPLRGWVKDFRPTTLQKSIMRTQDMRNIVSKKVPTKPFTPQGGKKMKFPQKAWIGKDGMDQETRQELRRKNLLYSCKESWEMGHRCMGKGKFHYIEVVSNKEDDNDNESIR
jgi:hypothetical protein